MMPRILIIAYGNPLRCDDGIAWRAADRLQDKFAEPDVEVLCQHQLAPEIAETLRNRQLVLFVDAACAEENNRAGEIRVRDLSRELHQREEGQFSHVYSPTKIVELARELYGATANAFVITVTGQNFAHGDNLSMPVADALPELIETIRRMVESVKTNPRKRRRVAKKGIRDPSCPL